MSKTHYELDKLVVSSKCTLSRSLLHSYCAPLLSLLLLLKGAHRPSSDDLKEWTPRPSDLGDAENGVRCAPEWRFYGPSFSPDDTAQADILYRSIADLYCSTYCVLLLFYDDGAIPSWPVESGDGERSPPFSSLRPMLLFRGSKMKKSLNFRH